jgi:hypothetical protein
VQEEESTTEENINQEEIYEDSSVDLNAENES